MSTHHDRNDHLTAAPAPTPCTEAETEKAPAKGGNCNRYPPPTAYFDDVAQSPTLFWEKLIDFHHSFGAKFMVPTVGGQALDLHHLFVEVTSRGGIHRVIRERKWKEVTAAFNFPTTITSASFFLRKYYLSLLYHFEQVYQFRKEVPSASTPDAANESFDSGSTDGDSAINRLPGSQQLQLGCMVAGTIDGKFENGYLISVDLCSEQLKGVLYHTQQAFPTSQIYHAPDVPRRQRRRRPRLALRDPSHPKSNRSGYNFFFAEHYVRLKPLHHGEERVIGKKIGLLWNNLTEAEKQVNKYFIKSSKAVFVVVICIADLCILLFLFWFLLY